MLLGCLAVADTRSYFALSIRTRGDPGLAWWIFHLGWRRISVLGFGMVVRLQIGAVFGRH